jgi:transducin (beta)-like 1
VAWSPDGKDIATSTSAGRVCVWVAEDGSCRCDFEDHKGPIFSLKWSPDGQSLLSAGFDRTSVVWNVAQGSVQQKFLLHTQPVLDCDWRDNDSFATCSVDKSILYCKLGQEVPVHTFKGHQDEVNGVKWDSSEGGKYLASCSDDGTATIWNLEASTTEAASFTKLVDDSCTKKHVTHDGDIHSICWRASDKCDVEDNDAKRKKRLLLLATASLDQTVKVMMRSLALLLFLHMHDHFPSCSTTSYGMGTPVLSYTSFRKTAGRCIALPSAQTEISLRVVE